MNKRNHKYGKTRKTLDKRHTNYIEYIKDLQNVYHDYEEKIQRLCDEFNSFKENAYLSAQEIYEKNWIYQTIKETEQKKNENEPQKVELEYYKDVSPILIEYHQNLGDSGYDRKQNHRNTDIIENEYLETIDPDYLDDSLHQTLSLCSYCESSNVIDMLHEYIRVCQDCGSKDELIIENDKTSYSDSNQEISYASYRRPSHLKVCLQLQQGKESTTIPQFVYDEVKKELSRQKNSWSNISQKTISDILDTLHHRYDTKTYSPFVKYKINTPQLWSKLTGKTLPQLSPETEKKVLEMFEQVMAVYPKFSGSDRKNFLSYHFCINKFLKMLGEYEVAQLYNKTQSKDKQNASEAMWRDICKELQWY